MSNENKPKVEPGWNDPPMLNYSASNPPPKSRITNKRVAYPLSSTSNNSNKIPQVLPSNLPPMPTVSTIDNAKENLGKLLKSNESREEFYKIWESELPEAGKKTLGLMTECLVNNNKTGADLHKQDFLIHHKHLCGKWLKDLKF